MPSTTRRLDDNQGRCYRLPSSNSGNKSEHSKTLQCVGVCVGVGVDVGKCVSGYTLVFRACWTEFEGSFLLRVCCVQNRVTFRISGIRSEELTTHTDRVPFR